MNAVHLGEPDRAGSVLTQRGNGKQYGHAGTERLMRVGANKVQQQSVCRREQGEAKLLACD